MLSFSYSFSFFLISQRSIFIIFYMRSPLEFSPDTFFIQLLIKIKMWFFLYVLKEHVNTEHLSLAFTIEESSAQINKPPEWNIQFPFQVL